MDLYNKHYERKDVNGFVIKAFSDAFEQPQEEDICINEQGGRHYSPDLFTEGFPKYRYVDGVKRECTFNDIHEYTTAKEALIPAPEKRQQAYTNMRQKEDGTPLILWQDVGLTVDEAKEQYLNYVAEASTKAETLQGLIKDAKSYIRGLYPG